MSPLSVNQRMVLHWCCLLGASLLLLLSAKVWKLFLVAGGLPSFGMLYDGLRWELLTWLCVALGLVWLTSRAWLCFLRLPLLYLFGSALILLTVWEHVCYLRTQQMQDLLFFSWLWRTWVLLGWKVAFPGVSQLWNLLCLAPVVLVGLPLLLSQVPAVQAQLRGWTPTSWWGSASLCLLLVTVVPPLALPQQAASPLYRSTWLSLIRQGVGSFWSQVGLPVRPGKLLLESPVRLVLKKRSQLTNVVLVVMDSTRSAETSVERPKVWTTPWLKRMASQSLWVERMYPVVTSPSQSLIPILCGTYPLPAPVGRWATSLPGLCLPKMLQTVGYQSAFFQSSSVYTESMEPFVFNLGFQSFRGAEDLQTKGFSKIQPDAFEDLSMLESVLTWVDDVRKQKVPFFLTIKTRTPHRLSRLPVGFPRRRFADYRGNATRRYLNSLRVQDRFLQQLFEELHRRNLFHSTLLVLVGTAAQKRRVPTLLFSHQLRRKPRVVRGLRQHVDLVPTLLDLLNFKVLGGVLPGTSLLKPADKQRRLRMMCARSKECLGSLSKRGLSVYTFGRRRSTSSPSTTRDLLWWRERIRRMYAAHRRRLVLSARSRSEPVVGYRVNARLGSYVRVVGANFKRRKVRPGGMLEITYVFQSLRSVPPGWRLFFHVGYGEGKQFVNVDHPLVGGALPLQHWRPGEYIKDVYRIRIPHKLRVGTRMRLYVGIWHPKKGRLPIHGPRLSVRTEGNKRLVLADFFL